MAKGNGIKPIPGKILFLCCCSFVFILFNLLYAYFYTRKEKRASSMVQRSPWPRRSLHLSLQSPESIIIIIIITIIMILVIIMIIIIVEQTIIFCYFCLASMHYVQSASLHAFSTHVGK